MNTTRIAFAPVTLPIPGCPILIYIGLLIVGACVVYFLTKRPDSELF